jgi:thiamine-monophosphate kinase
MPVGEFELIDRYFRRPMPARDDVLVGIGDDGAVLQVGAGQRLVTTLATLGASAWDASGGDPARLGHDVMAMALNRLAAVGAQPAWATLALTLTDADERWLAAFSDALFAVSTGLRVALVGGDTTRGPFCVTVVGHGLLGNDGGKLRRQIRAGDGLYMSGALGGGRAAMHTAPSIIRVELGRWIRARGGMAADMSAGAAAALEALLADAPLGAAIALEELPVVSGMQPPGDAEDGWSRLLDQRGHVELCFTLAREHHEDMAAYAAGLQIPVTRLASVDGSCVIAFVSADGRRLQWPTGHGGAPSA